MCVCVCVCACVCVCVSLLTPLNKQDVTQDQFRGGVKVYQIFLLLDMLPFQS